MKIIEINDQVQFVKTSLIHPQSTKNKSNYLVLAGSENFKTVKGGIVESRIKQYKLDTKSRYDRFKSIKYNKNSDSQMQIYRSCSHLYSDNDQPRESRRLSNENKINQPPKNINRRSKALSNSSIFDANESDIKPKRKRIFSQKSLGVKSSSNSSTSSRQNSLSSSSKIQACIIDRISDDDIKQLDNLKIVERKIFKAYELICNNISENARAISNGCNEELKIVFQEIWSNLKSDIQTISLISVPYYKNDKAKKMYVMNITKQINTTKYLYMCTACLGMLIVQGKQTVNQNMRTLFYNIYQNIVIFIEFALNINYKFIGSNCPTEVNKKLCEHITYLKCNKVIKSHFSKDDIEVILRRKNDLSLSILKNMCKAHSSEINKKILIILKDLCSSTNITK